MTTLDFKIATILLFGFGILVTYFIIVNPPSDIETYVIVLLIISSFFVCGISFAYVWKKENEIQFRHGVEQ